MCIECPRGMTAKEFLSRCTGKFLLLKVRVQGQITSVFVNKLQNGSASWRPREKTRRYRLDATWPGFDLTDETIYLSFDCLNRLIENFFAVQDALRRVLDVQVVPAIGDIPSDSEEMGRVLKALEEEVPLLNELHALSRHNLNTPSLLHRKSAAKSLALVSGTGMTELGVSILEAFEKSQEVYIPLPELRGFGDRNTARVQTVPEMRGAQLRHFMQQAKQQNTTNPLQGQFNLEFVAYEIKPLHLTSGLCWTCDSDPRTESIDLLLSHLGAPVLTEEKMQGDSFASSGLVQLLHYAAAMANIKQRRRLRREFPELVGDEPWLCILVEQRAGNERTRFLDDFDQTWRFVQHEECKRILGSRFAGIAMLTVEDGPWRMVEEHVVDWQ